MFRKENQEADDFRKKREDYAINIRKNNREQIFNKRRNIGTTSLNNEKQNDMINIVDLRFMNEIKQLHGEQYNEGMLEQYISMLQYPDVMARHRGAVGIRKITDNQNPTLINYIFQKGVIAKLFTLAGQSEYPQLKLQAIYALANITFSPNVCEKLTDLGFVDLTVKIIQQNQVYIVDHAITGLGNIAADSTKLRNFVLKSEGLQAVYKCLNQIKRQQTYFNCLWLLTNLIRGTPPPNFTLLESTIPIFCAAIKNNFLVISNSNDPQKLKVLSDILWALCPLTNDSRARIDRLIEGDIISVLFKCATFSQGILYFPAIRLIGSLANEGEKQTEYLINNGVFDICMDLLSHKKNQIRTETCWIISNIAAGVESQVDKLLERQDILDKVYQMLQTEDNACKEEIEWIFANLGHLGNKSKVIQLYLHYDIMKILVAMLNTDDAKFMASTLQVISRILMIGNKFLINGNNAMLIKFIEYQGVPLLQQLQNHESPKVYKNTINILTTFFDLDES